MTKRTARSPKMGVILDPIQSLNPKKDTSLRIMSAAEKRGWSIFIMEMKDLFLKDNMVFAKTSRVEQLDIDQPLNLNNHQHHHQIQPVSTFESHHWIQLGEPISNSLEQFDIILMRKDPPVDMEYIYTTFLLEQLEAKGCLVVNHPRSLRDANEKLYTLWFPNCLPKTLISANMEELKDFAKREGHVVFKPLGEMAGKNVFNYQHPDTNLAVILEMLTNQGQQFCIAQQFIPEISKGDKRIILIDGEPIPFALARIPKAGEFRGNLARGAQGELVTLSDNDYAICKKIGPTLQEKGLVLVGIDVIGDYLTEINVTSPTCMREIESLAKIDIASIFLDCVEQKLIMKREKILK